MTASFPPAAMCYRAQKTEPVTAFSGGCSVYEIKEFPDYKCVIVRAGWDAEIYKRDYRAGESIKRTLLSDHG
jgi:hypothetical protein